MKLARNIAARFAFVSTREMIAVLRGSLKRPALPRRNKRTFHLVETLGTPCQIRSQRLRTRFRERYSDEDA